MARPDAVLAFDGPQNAWTNSSVRCSYPVRYALENVGGLNTVVNTSGRS